MGKSAVIYKSKYGATKKYANWIAEETGADIFEASSVKPAQLAHYDIIVYGGGLYAGSIAGVKLITESKCNYQQRIIVFSVGLGDPDITDYSEVLKKNFTEEFLSNSKVFHFRGGIDYSKLGFVSKGIMSMVKKFIAKKPPSEQTDEEKGILETYGKAVDFTDKSVIRPLVEYIESLQKRTD